jgi:hypothetical protein
VRNVVILALAVLAGPLGCGGETPAPPAQTGALPQATDNPASPPDLTAERARAALIALIRSAESGELRDFPLEKFASKSVEGGDSDLPWWGPFCLHVQRREYSYRRIFGQPPRECTWTYRGRFELKEGRWVALPPQPESQALGSG